MDSKRAYIILHSALILQLFSIFHCLETGRNSSHLGCIAAERQALLEFKYKLKDPSGFLASWTGKDCCKWMGVTCNHLTGHILKLDLGTPDFCDSIEDTEYEDYAPSCLSGELSPSLLDLKYLTYLTLSNHNFHEIPIPSFIGSFKSLTHLDLSQAYFAGMIPPHIGNLSTLQYLDLTVNPYSMRNLWVRDLNWLPGLSSLKFLKLDGVNLKKASSHWPQKVNMLPSLLELHLAACQLSEFPDSLASVNFTSLSTLDLFGNLFNSSIPRWVFSIRTLVDLRMSNSELKGPITTVIERSLCKLQNLDLSFNNLTGCIRPLFGGFTGCSITKIEILDLESNKFQGSLPESLGFHRNLRVLQLGQNSLSGPIPCSLGNLSRLEVVGLSYNMMNGSILESFGQLTELTTLSLYSNSWHGTISETHFRNLTKLTEFEISSTLSNALKFNIRSDWFPSFSLKSIAIKNCQLGPAFPRWLRTQRELSKIILSGTAISDVIPDWLWEWSKHIWQLDLSGNELQGKLPKSLAFESRASINLESNHLEGSFPLWSNVDSLSLRSNRLSGPIPVAIFQELSKLRRLDASNNSLSGIIPPSVSRLKNLVYLDLSNNSLSGYIFEGWTSIPKLKVLDLSKNNLSGEFPVSICSLFPSLEWLKLGNNCISGKLSSSSLNCTRLSTLDLGDNKLDGILPQLTAQSLNSISELILRRNKFIGKFPEQLCRAPVLHVIDLANNSLTGSIPPCMGNMEGMQSSGVYYEIPPEFRVFYYGSIELNMKGISREYEELIPLVNMVDLSRNNLSGEIPEEITGLFKLHSLNLSRNHLIGRVPESISAMKELENLDLSFNNLSGLIPPSMVLLTSLSRLNLSYNNLSGEIPAKDQFQTYDTSAYVGNPGLCGPPLSIKCSSTEVKNNRNHDAKETASNEDGIDMFSYYLSMGIGFFVGFWSVCSTLAMKRSWRHAYFRFFDNVKDRVYVLIVVNIARLHNKVVERE